MGKVRRKRQKFHSAPVQLKNTHVNTRPQSINNVDEDRTEAVITKAQSIIPSLNDNIFKGMNIDKETLAQKLPDFDTRSAITSKSLKGLNLKKKDKLKLRHELWKQKLNAVHASREKEKKRLRRKKTKIIGDITDMEEALPTLELLLKSTTGPKRDKKIGLKEKMVPKDKTKQKRMMTNISVFKQVWKHSAFKANPGATICEHLRNKLLHEKAEDMQT